MRARMTRRAFGASAVGVTTAATSGTGAAATRAEGPVGYAVTAPYYDLMAEPAWRDKLGPAVRRLWAGFDPRGEWMVDVGAGTGLSTAALIRAVPSARALAVEPDPSMRAALMTRLTADPILRARVSVLPSGLFEADLPGRIGGLLMVSTLHHFDPAGRARLWRLLAERLTPGGLAAIEVQLPANGRVPRSLVHRARVGDVDYEAWMQAEPVGRDLQRWRMTYRATRAGRRLDEQTAVYDMHVADFARVAGEASHAGLTARRADEFVVLRRA